MNQSPNPLGDFLFAVFLGGVLAALALAYFDILVK